MTCVLATPTACGARSAAFHLDVLFASTFLGFKTARGGTWGAGLRLRHPSVAKD